MNKTFRLAFCLSLSVMATGLVAKPGSAKNLDHSPGMRIYRSVNKLVIPGKDEAAKKGNAAFDYSLIIANETGQALPETRYTQQPRFCGTNELPDDSICYIPKRCCGLHYFKLQLIGECYVEANY